MCLQKLPMVLPMVIAKPTTRNGVNRNKKQVQLLYTFFDQNIVEKYRNTLHKIQFESEIVCLR